MRRHSDGQTKAEEEGPIARKGRLATLDIEAAKAPAIVEAVEGGEPGEEDNLHRQTNERQIADKRALNAETKKEKDGIDRFGGVALEIHETGENRLPGALGRWRLRTRH